ncbi:CMD domain protein [Plantibacter sp. YIM 135249]|uniref:CMD domain protein n=1 Tax=Plantibacter sp. YIM 135249 TaxID=3423918 RepID=UPI003D336333
MPTATVDVIDLLVGIDPDTSLDALRRIRPETRNNAQASYDALFEPRDAGEVTALERFAIASFVASLNGDAAITEHYLGRLAALDGGTALAATIAEEAAAGATTGPYGAYPHDGPLQAENTTGLVYAVQSGNAASLGRLAAALEHTHLLVFRPREASSAALQRLLDAGWSTNDIVTISQLVAFLSFQYRVVVGLRLISEES